MNEPSRSLVGRGELQCVRVGSIGGLSNFNKYTLPPKRPPSMMHRRELIQSAVGTAAVGLISTTVATKALLTHQKDRAARIRFCLNMSTIQGQKIEVPEQIKIAAKAGYTESNCG